MTKGKPIEPGCLALIVGSKHDDNNGRTVRVIRKLGEREVYVPPEVVAARNGRPLRPHPELFNDTRWLVVALTGKLLYGVTGINPYTGERKRIADYSVAARGVAEKRLIRIDGEEDATPRIEEVVMSKPTEEVF